MITVVPRSSWIPIPWKNGGGVTHELVVEGDPFVVRLSVAEVASDGPFSRFPGIDRTIVLLEGPGFRLRRDDGLEVTLRDVGVPFAFHGEDAWSCTVLGGVVLDFNVMVDRRFRRALVGHPVGGRAAGEILALADGVVVDGIELRRFDLARSAHAVAVSGPAVVVSTVPVRGEPMIEVVSPDQLRADLFELGQLSRAVGLDPARIAAHVATIRRDAAALLGDRTVGALAAEVVRACDRLEHRPITPVAAPTTSPRSGPPEPAPVETALRIGLTSGDRRWVWRFAGDLARLRREWADGYLPVQLVSELAPFRGILGEVAPVDTFDGDPVDHHATASPMAFVLHLPEGDLRWRLRVDVALLSDGEHRATWSFPHAAPKLLEEWRAGRAPLHDMPEPRVRARDHLGTVVPPTGAESAQIHLAPGHATRLVLDGKDHPLTAPLDLPDAKASTKPPPLSAGVAVFDPGDGAWLTRDAAGFDGDAVVRLAVFALTADQLRAADLRQVTELTVGSTDPDVLAALASGVSDRLRTLTLRVDAPAVVAPATGLVRLNLVRVPTPPLPASLRALYLTGPVDAAALAAAVAACPALERVVLAQHGLDAAALAPLTGLPWALDPGPMPGWVTGLDVELAGLVPQWDLLNPILDRWMVQLWSDLTAILAIERTASPWARPTSAWDGAVGGPPAL
ncbi:MAG: HutD family protein, partial [Myxococcota bacterium]